MDPVPDAAGPDNPDAASFDFEGSFNDLLAAITEDLGARFDDDLDAISGYAAERADHLVTLFGQAGYNQAVIAERDNIALRAGVNASRSADHLDQQILAMLHGGLRMGVRALVAL